MGAVREEDIGEDALFTASSSFSGDEASISTDTPELRT